MKILIVEDDKNILGLLEKGFLDNNYIIDKADNGEDGKFLAMINTYDVIILDWMLPKISGIELLKNLREENIKTPILMLTAKDNIEDKVKGLKTGCDDYLSKPFNFEELVARIEALYRRYKNNYSSDTISINDIKILKDKKQVFKNDTELVLTSKEFEILMLLIENKNSYISKSMIEDMIYNNEQIISSNVVSVTIYNLRKKIGNEIIKNFRGLGYKIEI